jgi:hypothetical protein
MRGHRREGKREKVTWAERARKEVVGAEMERAMGAGIVGGGGVRKC